MNSDDGSDPSDPRAQHQRRKPRLKVGDTSEPHFDRASTVMVNPDDPTPPPGSLTLAHDQPTPPPRSQRFQSQAVPAVGSPQYLDADEPTPPPSSAHLPQNRGYHQQPGTGRHQPVSRSAQQAPVSGTGQHQPISRNGPPPTVSGSFSSVPSNQPSSGYDENITSTGFLPPENFRPTGKHAAISGKNPAGGSSSVNNLLKNNKFSLPEFTFVDDTTLLQRAQYGGGGFLGGALAGTCLGVLNCILQGWDVADGLGQIFWLSVLMGTIFAVFSALRPERVDELLSRLSFLQDSEPPPSNPRFDD